MEEGKKDKKERGWNIKNGKRKIMDKDRSKRKGINERKKRWKERGCKKERKKDEKKIGREWKKKKYKNYKEREWMKER